MRAQDFSEVIADKAEGRINDRLTEIKSNNLIVLENSNWVFRQITIPIISDLSIN